MSDETCQRCGDEGPDLRTLWHACLYEMRETGVPFGLLQVCGGARSLVKTEQRRMFPGGPMAPVDTFADEAGPEQRRVFYTLRVCKACRGDWMRAIAAWFSAGREEVSPTGTGVYVREMGATRELTEAEVASRWPKGAA